MSPRTQRTPMFTQTFQGPCRAVLECNVLPLTALRIWCYMLWSLDAYNMVTITQATMAERLKLAKGQVSKAVQTLLRQGLVTREPAADTRFWCYRVPSDFAHVGRLKDVQWRRQWEDWQRGMDAGDRPDQGGR